jgi:hypothetical protein
MCNLSLFHLGFFHFFFAWNMLVSTSRKRKVKGGVD